MVRDITERKLMEERLRQSEKMTAIGQLAGGIAHDFNNQLAAMLGYAELLVARLTDEELRLFANMIVGAATHSGDLTRQLLAFARKGKRQTMPVEIHGIINDVVALLTRTVDRRINIKRMLAANPSTTMGDPIQLQNALLNLAINARDAMPNGGELVFATDVVVLTEAHCRIAPQHITPGEYVEISITDTGVGMSQETQKRLFEPFFTTKEPGKGTGMGLASVYGTVADHQGTISFRSEPNRGTTFTLQLPVLVETAPSIELPTARAETFTGTAHILLADDEKVAREAIAAGLRHLGYRVTTCADGAEAVARYSDDWREIDLVMLDMVMPKLGGHDAFLAMRKVNPAVKALLSSGYTMDSRVQNLVDGGGVYFVQKPFHLGALSKVVATALRK
jgi:nitrogen-specific signal transduction histidine kinase/CheY-like chemotaxis protein